MYGRHVLRAVRLVLGRSDHMGGRDQEAGGRDAESESELGRGECEV